MDLQLHHKHLGKAGLQRGENDLLLFFAKLPQHFFELGPRLGKLADRLIFVLHPFLALQPLQFLFGLMHGAAGRLKFLATGRLLGSTLLLLFGIFGGGTLLLFLLFALFLSRLVLLSLARLFLRFAVLGVLFLGVPFLLRFL
jgi:hypothetical protein